MKTPRPSRRYLRCPAHWSVERRLAYYAKPDPISGCHIWQKPPNSNGYGQLRIKQKIISAHRLSWAARHGRIPAGMVVCHRCDEKLCINPDHLFLGSQGDNMADLKAKRLHRSDARAEPGADTQTSDEATIRIIYRGVELVGQVKVAAVDPRVKAVEARAAAGAPPPHSARPSTPDGKESQ
jgi:hypothetical protein